MFSMKAKYELGLLSNWCWELIRAVAAATAIVGVISCKWNKASLFSLIKSVWTFPNWNCLLSQRDNKNGIFVFKPPI